MTKDEALKLALSALDEVRQETFRLMRDGQTLYAEDKVWSTIISIKEVLAQEQEPVGKLQEPTTERSWFTIAELNAWADKNLAENPNWVMPTEEPEREWVGLTKEEIAEFDTWHDNMEEEVGWCNPSEIVAYIEAKLKQKNGYAEEKNT